MTHDAYSTKRVTVCKEDKVSAGELVPGYSITYQDGCTSWCPEAVYLRDYQPLDALSFGHALDALKRGDLVGRKGWNGKGMFLYLVTPEQPDVTGLDDPSAVVCMILPYIAMKTADDCVVPWLASQTDMLANDWQVL